VTSQRVFAILAAVLLVSAVALAMLGPPSLPLGQALLMLDRDMTEAVHEFIQHNLFDWVWTDVFLPLLIRPAWLIPVALGLVCAGVAMSLPGRKAARRPHRRSPR
jgi:hypothetical protein